MRKLIAAITIATLAVAGGAYFLLQKNVSSDVEAGVKNLFANLPADYLKRGYGKVTVDLASQSATIEAIDLERNDGRKLKIAKLEIANIDTAAINAIIDTNAYKAGAIDATFKTLAGRITATGVQADDGKTLTDIARLVVYNLQGRQFPSAPTPEWRNGLKNDQMTAIALRTFKLDSAEIDQLKASAKNGSAEIKRVQIGALNGVNIARIAFDAFRFTDTVKSDSIVVDRLEIGDFQWEKLLEFTADGKSPANFSAALALYRLGRLEIGGLAIKDGKGGTDIVLPKLSVTGFDADGLSTVGFSGLVVRSAKEGADISIGEFEMAGLQWAGLIEGMRDGSKGVMLAMSKKRAWLDKLTVRNIGGSYLDNLGLSIAEISVLANRLNEDAERSVLKISGIGIDATKSKSSEVKQVFQMLEYQRAVFDFAIGGKIDRKAKSFEIDQFTIAAPQIGTFDLKLALENFVDQVDPEKSMESLLAASLKGFSVSYSDAGLVPKLIKIAAQQQGASEADFRAMLLEQIKGMTEVFAQAPAIVAAGESIKAFLLNPKSLTLVAAPTNPVPLAQLGGAKDDPPALIDLLKLSLVYK